MQNCRENEMSGLVMKTMTSIQAIQVFEDVGKRQMPLNWLFEDTEF